MHTQPTSPLPRMQPKRKYKSGRRCVCHDQGRYEFPLFSDQRNDNVKAEWYLVSMAYNILKLHHKIQTGRLGNHLFTQATA